MIAERIRQAVDQVIERRLRDPKQRQFIAQTIMNGFEAVPKKPVPDLPQRIERMRERVYAMTADLRIGFVGESLVVKVAGSSEALMKELRRGTEWYSPWEKVDEILFAATLVDPEK